MRSASGFPALRTEGGASSRSTVILAAPRVRTVIRGGAEGLWSSAMRCDGVLTEVRVVE